MYVSKVFHCILCGGDNYQLTSKRPRDRKEANIVICGECGHVQMFPLLPPEV